MKAKTEKGSAELYIYDEIDGSGYYGISDKAVIAALAEIGKVDELHVRINSGGGDVFAGVAIYEALRRFDAKIIVHVDGIAASIASVIAMAGDERHISSAGFFMIHRAFGFAMGTDEDMRKMADVLESISDRIAVIYNERTGQDVEDLKQAMQEETWMNADDSFATGFATNIDSGKKSGTTASDIEAKLLSAKNALKRAIESKVATEETPDLEAEDIWPPEEEPDAAPVAVMDLKQAAPVAALFLNKTQEKKEMTREEILRGRLETATIKAEQIRQLADTEERDLTGAEIAAIKELKVEMDGINAQIEALVIVNSATERLAQPQPRKGETPKADRPQAGQTTVISSAAYRSSNGGFDNFSEFALAVQNVFTGGPREERLFRNSETAFSTGGVGSEGGFAIPEDFRREIYSNAIENDPLISRCFQLPTASRQVTLPTHESQAWGTDSMQAYWTGEGASITRSQYAMNQVTIQVNKTAAISFVTEELLEDAPALQSALIRDASEKLNFAVSNAIVRGSGVNQPLGFLNSPSLVTVAKETAGSTQTADTVVVENLVKMYGAMPSRNRATAVWLVHPDVEQQIWLGKYHASADPIGIPPGGIPNSPFGVILGRPVIPHEVCETVGDLGDVMFVDLSQYALPMKTGGLKTQTSMHLAFDQDLMAFKFTMRVGGAPLWQSVINSRDGSFDRSPFVVLASR